MSANALKNLELLFSWARKIPFLPVIVIDDFLSVCFGQSLQTSLVMGVYIVLRIKDATNLFIAFEFENNKQKCTFML